MKKSILLFLIVVLTLSVQSGKKLRNFSSPEALIETFFSAAKNKNKRVLSTCFSKRSPGEWEAIRTKKASKKFLNELKNFVTGAVINKVDMRSENDAFVYVTFNTRSEKIHTVKEGDRWFILDF